MNPWEGFELVGVWPHPVATTTAKLKKSHGFLNPDTSRGT
jgi:hypothetical protein